MNSDEISILIIHIVERGYIHARLHGLQTDREEHGLEIFICG